MVNQPKVGSLFTGEGKESVSGEVSLLSGKCRVSVPFLILLNVLEVRVLVREYQHACFRD